jgi:hypothetical protein
MERIKMYGFPREIGASVYEILKHLKRNRATVCIYCEKDQKTMANLRLHVSPCWMVHGTTWKEATK